jgi:hypothetical protein
MTAMTVMTMMTAIIILGPTWGSCVCDEEGDCDYHITRQLISNYFHQQCQIPLVFGRKQFYDLGNKDSLYNFNNDEYCKTFVDSIC